MTARLSRPTQRLAPARPTAPRGAHIHLAARPSDQKALSRACPPGRLHGPLHGHRVGVLARPASLGRALPASTCPAPLVPAASILPVVCGGSPPRPALKAAAAGQRAAASERPPARLSSFLPV